MKQIDFDEKFQAITTEMVEIAYELVEFQNSDVDAIYIITSFEQSLIFFNMFYKVNKHVCKISEINKYSNVVYNLTDDRVMKLQRLGNDSVKKINLLFQSFSREVPSSLKIKFYTKSKKFECKLFYGLQYSFDETKGFHNVFFDWFKEIKSSEDGV